MTYPIPRDSLKALASEEFGRELRRAMTTRKVGSRLLAQEIGVGRTAICHYLKGAVLPRVAAADSMAAALAWPELAEAVRLARTVVCRSCGAEFCNDSGGPARYCSARCQRVAAKAHVGVSVEKRADVAERRLEEASATLGVHQELVAAFCRECEPSGICRTSGCQLRAVSPLPLHTVYGAIIPPAIRSRGNGRHSDQRREAHALRMRQRWASDEVRARQADQSRAWWASLSPEQRQEQIERIRTGKRSA
jgi:hypothetical protein